MPGDYCNDQPPLGPSHTGREGMEYGNQKCKQHNYSNGTAQTGLIKPYYTNVVRMVVEKMTINGHPSNSVVLYLNSTSKCKNGHIFSSTKYHIDRL